MAVVLAEGTSPIQGLVSRLVDQVDGVVVVHDASPRVLGRLADLSGTPTIDLVAMPAQPRSARRAAGVDRAISWSAGAVLLVDPDEPPPPDFVPDFITALAGHDAAVGDRTAERARVSMAERVMMWLVAVVLRLKVIRRLPDPCCPTRIFTVDAIRAVPFDMSSCSGDAAHLKAMLAQGLSVTWVPMPARHGLRRRSGPTAAGRCLAALGVADASATPTSALGLADVSALAFALMLVAFALVLAVV